MRILSVIAAIALAVLVVPGLAWAQANDVTLVSPDQIDAATDYLPAAIGAAFVAIIARFMGPFAWVLKVARVDQIIAQNLKGVIDEFLDSHPQIRTRGFTVDVKNAMIAEVANRVLAVAPGWLLAFMGGPDGLKQKIRNRLPDALKDIFGYFPVPGVAPSPAAPPQVPVP